MDSRYVLALCLLSCLLWLPRFRGPIDLRFDAGVYYVLGTALADGAGYRLLNEPGQIRAIQYPPGLPAFVALHQRLLGTSDPLQIGAWIRVSYFLISTLYLCAVYWLATRFLTPGYAFLAAVLTALQFHTYFQSNMLFAEIPFALVSVLFVLATRWRSRVGGTALATLLVWTAYSLRSAGMALMAAWVAESLFRRRFRQAGVRLLLCAIPVFAWQGYIYSVKSADDYARPAYPYQRAAYQNYNVGYLENILLIDSFLPELGQASPGDLARRILANAARIPVTLGEAVSAARGFWTRRAEVNDADPRLLVPYGLGTALVLLLFGLICAGALLQVRRGRWLIPLYVLATLGLMCLTPWPKEFLRYLSPVTPFLAVLLLASASTFHARPHGAPRSALRTAGLVLCLGAAAPALLIECYTAKDQFVLNLTTARHRDADGDEVQSRLFYHDRAWRAFDRAVAWLGENADPAAIVCTTAPHLVYLETHLRAVQPPYEPDPDAAARLIDAVLAEYVIIDRLDYVDVSQRYARPAIEPQVGSVWEEVYADPEGLLQVYRRSE